MRTLVAAVLLALLALAPAAHAAGPEPCAGDLVVKDAAGDQTIKVQGQGVQAAPANTDALGLFYRVDEGVTTVNIVIADLNKTLPQGFEAIRYRAYVTVDGAIRYLEALLTADGVAYSYGSQLPALSYTKDGDTKGAIFEGKTGVVQIVIPADAGGKPGTKLDAVSASIGLLTVGDAPPEAQTTPIYFGVDTAPDGTSTVSTTPPQCPPPAAAPADPGGQTPPAEQQPAPQQQPQQQPPAQQQQQPAQPPAPFQASEFRLSLARASLSARKTKKLAKLSLRSTERLTSVTVKLQRGSKVLSRLSFATLESRRTLKLKLKRRLKRGSHRLVVSGTRPDGTRFTERLGVRVTR
jgi:hypothetical protein